MKKIKGVICALVTPFKNNEIDENALKSLLQFHINQKTDALVIAGTTGEAATLKKEEREFLFKKSKEFSKNEISLIAGCGTNDTDTTLEYIEIAEKTGYETALLVCPYYNKPTQQGLYAHFKTVAKNTKMKIILYNVPGRTSSNILPETVKKLINECDNIIGIKEASKNLDQMMELYSLTKGKISLLSGDDSWTYPLLLLGYDGVISVFANILPRPFKEIIYFIQNNEIEKAMETHYKYLPLMNALFIETNPVPVKTFMEILGWISGEVRLPLVRMEKGNAEKLKKLIKSYKFPQFP